MRTNRIGEEQPIDSDWIKIRPVGESMALLEREKGNHTYQNLVGVGKLVFSCRGLHSSAIICNSNRNVRKNRHTRHNSSKYGLRG